MKDSIDKANVVIGKENNSQLYSSNRITGNIPKRRCYLNPKVKILIGSGTHQGKIRGKNEDAYLYDVALGLFILADGIGGNRHGEIASSLAVKSIRNHVLQKFNNYIMKKKSSTCTIEPLHEHHYSTLMSSALVEANDVVLKASLEKEDLDGMGTTVVAFLFSPFRDTVKEAHSDTSSFYIAGVGDSSVYSIIKVDNKLDHGDETQAVKVKVEGILKSTHLIKKLTKDHTVAEMLIESNQISREEGKKHQLRHVLTKYLGMKNKEDLLADLNIQEFHLKKNDYLLMCSDGLTNMLDDHEICRTIVTENDKWMSKQIIGHSSELHGEDPRLKHICNSLIHKANENGGTDNITVILIQKSN